jgi:nicotinamidase-related amidase
MTISVLDPHSALIVIDLQKGILSSPTVHPAAQIVERASELAAALRRHGLPVVWVTVAGAAAGRTEQPPRNFGQQPAGWSDLVPELDPQPVDHRVIKRTWGAFTNTDLEGYLKKLGVTQVVIAGVATSAGVESTARHAHELGFNVTLAIDAMTDRNADAMPTASPGFSRGSGRPGRPDRSLIYWMSPELKKNENRPIPLLEGHGRCRRLSVRRHSRLDCCSPGGRRGSAPIRPVRTTHG